MEYQTKYKHEKGKRSYETVSEEILRDSARDKKTLLEFACLFD
ncbi:MAG: hypothetical protein ACOCUU_03555 [Nanoarchaeota archaeon]